MHKNKKFDILNNAGKSITDRLEAEFPPRDEKEKEKIFSMSERKFNIKTNGHNSFDEHTVSGVEVYKRPVWQRFIGIAAAFAVVAGGITGGAFAMKRFRNTPVASSESEGNTQRRIAPFGDFAELDYKLQKTDPDSIQKIIVNDDEYPGNFIPLYAVTDISQEKRQKLADFFNNFDYDSAPAANVEYKSFGTSEAEFEDYKENSEIEDDMPVFQSCVDNEVRRIYFIDLRGKIDEGDLKNPCVLSYDRFRYTEQDGQLLLEKDSFSTINWVVDYEYFKNTINGILNADDDTADKPLSNVTDSFGDFAAYDFFIPDVTKENRMIVKKEDIAYEINNGDVIPQDKRQQIEDLFNCQYWNKVDLPEKTDVYAMGTLCFVACDDREFRIITLDPTEGILIYDHFEYEDITDENGFVIHQAKNGGKDTVEAYALEYEYFREKLYEILGDSCPVDLSPDSPDDDEEKIDSFTDLRFFIDREWGYGIEGQPVDYSQLDINVSSSNSQGEREDATFTYISYNDIISVDKKLRISELLGKYDWEPGEMGPGIPNSMIYLTSKSDNDYLSMRFASLESTGQTLICFDQAGFKIWNDMYIFAEPKRHYSFLDDSYYYVTDNDEVISKMLEILSEPDPEISAKLNFPLLSPNYPTDCLLTSDEESSEKVLTEKDKKFVRDLIYKNSWSFVAIEPDADTEADISRTGSDYIMLKSEKNADAPVICIETISDKTCIFEYTLKKTDGKFILTNGKSYQCHDNSIIEQIKKYFSK